MICDIGTGKTTVVVQILTRLIKNSTENSRILMTASTHNGKLFEKLCLVSLSEIIFLSFQPWITSWKGF